MRCDLRSMRGVATLCAVLVLASACKDDVTGPGVDKPVPVAPGQSVEQVIGASGGTMSLLTTEGAKFDLELPAGAVAEGTVIRITTVATSGDQLFHLRFAPAGLLLADGNAAALTIDLSGADTIPLEGGVVYDGVPVAFERLSEGRVRVRLTAFAEEAAGAVRTPNLLADNTAPLCDGGPSNGTFASGGLIGSSELELLIYGNCMVGAVQRLASSGAHADAVRAALSAAALLQAAGQQGGSASAAQFISTASTIACSAQRQALDNANGTSVTNFGTLANAVRPIFFWEQVIQSLGATCANVGATEYQTVISAKTDQAIAFYEGKDITDVDSDDYSQGLSEARGSRTLVQQVQSIPAGDNVKTFAQSEVRERTQAPLLATLLEAPWRECRDVGSYADLIELMEVMENADEIKEAAQYCGTQLGAESRNGAGDVVATLAPTLGGVSASEVRTDGSLNITTDGVIRLSGTIRALQCPAGSAGGTEQLQLRLGSHVLQTITTAPYLNSVLELDVEESLQAAGINVQQFTSATLGVYRVGSPCGGFWGEAPAPLLRVTVQGGLCAPAEGRDHCVTVLADFNNPALDFHYATALSDRNGHVLVYSTSGPSIWHRGTATKVPESLVLAYGTEYGGHQAIADNGAVVGLVTTAASDPSFQPLDFMPTVFVPPGAQLRSLLAQPLPYSDAFEGYVSQDTSRRTRRDPATLTISPQGRITFTVLEDLDLDWPTSDLGYCGTVTLTTGSAYDCFRYTRYEASVGGAGFATIVQQIAAPSTGEMHFVLFDGGTGVGRYGFSDSLISQNSVLGGIGAYRRIGDAFRSREFVTGSPRTYGRHLAADRSGRTLTQSSGYELLPASAALPSGWSVGALGLDGHVQMCGPDGPTTRLVRLSDGQTLMQITAYNITHQGRTIEVSGGCVPGNRNVDSLGRMLGNGWIESESRQVPVILTPAGVALP